MGGFACVDIGEKRVAGGADECKPSPRRRMIGRAATVEGQASEIVVVERRGWKVGVYWDEGGEAVREGRVGRDDEAALARPERSEEAAHGPLGAGVRDGKVVGEDDRA